MISFLNALLVTTAFVELVVAALVYAVFRRERDASAKSWVFGCLLMAAGMLLLPIRMHLPAPVSFGLINFIMLFALALHGHSFWLLAHPKARFPRVLLVLCIGYGLLQWGLSLTPMRDVLALVAALCWMAMHIYFFWRLRPLTDRLPNLYFQMFVYLLATGAVLWLLRAWVVSNHDIALSSDFKTANLLSIASVHMVLIAQQISYLVVRLSDEKRLKEEIDSLHATLQIAWQDRLVAIQARQDERQQLLRDLHDGFGSKLAGLRLQVQKQRLTHTQVVEYLKEILADLNLFADTLGHDDITLEHALIDMRHRTESRHADGPPRLQWLLRLQNMPELEARTALHILRVIQEAMHNAIRHAAAQHISIGVEYIAPLDRLVISVRDDGLGMNLNARKGQGLNSMQQRAREIGASLVWLPESPGTEVLLTLNFRDKPTGPPPETK